MHVYADADGFSPQRILGNNIHCIRDNGVLYDW